MLPRSERHRAPLLWLLLPFLAGAVVAHSLPQFAPSALLLAVAAASVLAAFGCLSRPHCWAVLITVGLGCAGAAHLQRTVGSTPDWGDLPPRAVVATLEVERLFAAKPGAWASAGIGVMVAAEDASANLCRRRVYFSLRPRKGAPILPSEILVVNGVIRPVDTREGIGTFDGFLANQGVTFRLERGRILRQASPPTTYRRFCHRALESLARSLSQGMADHPKAAAALNGMLLGRGGELQPSQKQLYLESGTLHLFSISGLHIGAIAVAFHLLFGLLRLPRWLHFAVSTVALWLYVDITGSSPSAVRAFWMVVLVEAAFTLKRPVNPVATLALAAWLAAVMDPRQLFSASFQMSYGIVAGLLLLGLPLAERWHSATAPFQTLPRPTWALWQRAVSWLHQALCTSTAIGMATSLVSTFAGLLYFELITPGALLANLVVIPIASFSLWAGFLSLLAGGAGVPALSVVFNHAAAVILTGSEACLRVTVALPGSFAHAAFRSTPLGFFAFGGLILLLMLSYGCNRRGALWLPFLWTAGFLLGGVRYGA